ncbi:hypothetical protein PUN28_016021 [Cardiocondyla obscurior]|uniref:Uncharacterized protein n=1 Tax=Cardiocondyla obscurior TaxID=286306 RepID=A0AAW2ET10_9HYME
MRVLVPLRALRPFFPRAEQCAEKCAIGEKNGPLPLWSSGPLELFCFHLRKGASYRREGAFATSGLDFFSLSYCPAVCHYVSSRLSAYPAFSFIYNWIDLNPLNLKLRALLISSKVADFNLRAGLNFYCQFCIMQSGFASNSR